MAEMKYKDKPTAAFVLTLIGGVLVLIGGLLIATVGAMITFFIGGLGGLFGLLGIIVGAIMIIAAIEMNTTDANKVRTWSIVALILSIISIGNGGGFFLGFILGLIGSILGLTHK
ncbi:MAG: DUF6114 domain-containing protein [Candidatus Micrarchaeia archaeon]